MASVINETNGRKRVEFIAPDGKRRRVRLGIVSVKQADEIKRKVEAIVSDMIVGRAHDNDVARWMRDLDGKMLRRIRRVGLFSGDARSDMSLKDFLDKLVKTIAKKASTKTFYGHTIRNLLACFGNGRVVRTITTADGDTFRAFLQDEGLAETTISRRVIAARTIWNHSIRWKLTSENVFTGVRAGQQKNKARQFTVSPDVITDVLNACPDNEWKLIVALSRYGGLRTPSEHRKLRWVDIDWNRPSILVHSPKTEHHQGGECRTIPLFPEILPFLRQQYEDAETGAEFVLSKYRLIANLGTRFKKIIKRAGHKPWPRVFNNLRSSRETELSAEYPMQMVTEWIGNTPETANDHYLQHIDAFFQKATAGPPEKAAHEQAQRVSADVCTKVRQEPAMVSNHSEKSDGCALPQTVALACGSGEIVSSGRYRTRQPSETQRENDDSEIGGARNGACPQPGYLRVFNLIRPRIPRQTIHAAADAVRACVQSLLTPPLAIGGAS